MPTERPTASIFLGLFFITLATLMQEILLTRIFSVTMWYHFAFMAISLAMFGMTAGAVLVFLAQKRMAKRPIAEVLALHSLLYAFSLGIGFVIYLKIPFYGASTAKGVTYLTLSYIVTAVPFVFSGIAVALVLSTYPRYAGSLYAADLIGAALGCVLLLFALELTDAATAVFAVAAFGALAAAAFVARSERFWPRLITMLAALLVVCVPVVLTFLSTDNRPLIAITDTSSNPNNAYRYERWNSYSRVTVGGDPSRPGIAAGWGLSQESGAANETARQLVMWIDTWASTVITRFDGDLNPLWFLRDDVTNIAHYTRPNSDVFVVGMGGGRDVLSALVFKQKSVTGVEVNRDVLRATTEVFGDFAGHLERHPKVTVAVDEARSYLTRLDKKFDIIQLSLIDTWAATAAGAFVLTENSLYTAEGWTIFLRHLTARGVLSVSRWYYPNRPGEALRVTALAREALGRIGVANPRQHVVIVKAPRACGMPGLLGNGIATILVARQPFSRADLDILNKQTRRLGFKYLVTPVFAADPSYSAILDSRNPEAFYRSFPLDISPPTDDRPFFFQMLRIGDLMRPLDVNYLDPNHVNLEAIKLLGALLAIVTVLTIACILVPLAVSSRRGSLRGSSSLLVYFLAIGLGFMFIEVAQMQRLMILLGKPTYALSVVLFTLLVGSGIGSLLSDRLGGQTGRFKPTTLLAVVIAVVALSGFITPIVVQSLSSATATARILAAVGTLLPMGFVMGWPFPLGLHRAIARPDLIPWLWGLNGAASVLCSVLAIVVALAYGITASFISGVLFYSVAFFAYLVSVSRAE